MQMKHNMPLAFLRDMHAHDVTWSQRYYTVIKPLLLLFIIIINMSGGAYKIQNSNIWRTVMVNSKVIKLAILVYSFHYKFSVDNEFLSSTLTEQNSRCRAEFQSLSRILSRICDFYEHCRQAESVKLGAEFIQA